MNKPVLYPLSLPITQAGSVLDVWLTHHADGRQHHVASGVWRFENGQEFPVSATIRGEVAVKRRPVGRPEKTLRNIGAFMAFWLFFLQERDAVRASKRVLNHWQEKFWPGAHEQKDLNKLIKRGHTELRKVPGVIFAPRESDAAPYGGTGWVERRYLTRTVGAMHIDGPGYWWDPRDQEPISCHLTLLRSESRSPTGEPATD